MKQFLKILLAVSIIAFSASITAVSCGKTADPNNNNNANNNSGGGGDGGGDGNGGGGTPAEPAIVIENVDASVVEVKNGTDIELKASGFPTTAINADIASSGLTALYTSPANSVKRAFDIVIKGTGGAAATGGLILVNTGDKSDANSFTMDEFNHTIGGYSLAEQKQGLRPVSPSPGPGVVSKVGWNIFGIFMNSTAPTTAAANATPFAFTATAATQPVLFCRTTVTTVTGVRVNAGPGTLQDTTALTGGQKASCYVGATGQPFVNGAADTWLTTAAGNTFKKKFDISVAGIKTDAKTLSTMGLTGGAASLSDGLTTAEMTQLTTANESAFKKFSVSLVRDAGFTYVAPEITFQNFDAAAKLVAGGVSGATDTIRIKGSEIPTTAVRASGFINVGDLWNAPTGTLKRIFDITITGGVSDGSAATGGLIMVGGGNITSVDGFSDNSGGIGNGGTVTEGFESGQADTLVQNVFRHSGWNFYGVFMNRNAPANAAQAAANASPFAFTPVENTNFGWSYDPFMFCRTTIPAITTRIPERITFTTTFAGGQTAHCYVGWKGFRMTIANWLANPASNTFKRTFNMAIGGFRTDAKTIVQFMPGTSDVARRTALSDGLSSAEIAAIVATNPGAFRTVSVTIVSDADF